jgi:2-oxoglutarate ferredoxin oxidoreductase subunit delta
VKKQLKQQPVVIETKLGHRITIIKQFCKGCEICVNFCPKDVLSLEPKTMKVIVLNPDQCTGCRLCELYCPDFAVFVETARKAAAKLPVILSEAKNLPGRRCGGAQP